MIDAIREGTAWGTLAQNFYRAGYVAVENIVKLMDGEEVDDVTDSGLLLITQDNVETYTTEW